MVSQHEMIKVQSKLQDEELKKKKKKSIYITNATKHKM